MSIISQIGVIILIIGTIFVLIRSNRQLEEAAREGEHFVDEWALRESLKEERKKQISASKEPAHRVFRASRPSFLDQPNTEPESEPEFEEESEYDTAEGSLPESESDLIQDPETRQNHDARQNFEFSHNLEFGQDPATRQNFDPETLQNPRNFRNNLSGIQSQANHKQKSIIKEVNLTLVEPADSQSPGRTIQVGRLPFTIGRAPDNDLVIDDLAVAKHHCRIIWKDQLIVMEDAGSRNKIYVNGNPQVRAVLKDNLLIGIGNKEFVVLRGDQTWRKQSAGK